MKLQNSRSHVAARRGELLAELFLDDLEPVFVSRNTTTDVGYDLLVGFQNEKSGINTFAIQLKATERPVGSRFPIQRETFNRIAHSNLPGLLLVADVKRSRLYYAWLRTAEVKVAGGIVSIPLVEIDETTKAQLKKQFERVEKTKATA